VRIHLDLSLVSSYPNLYLGSLLIITGVGTSCIFSEKVFDVASLSIDIWKTRWIEYIDSGR